MGSTSSDGKPPEGRTGTEDVEIQQVVKAAAIYREMILSA